jgi:hypothetical protein
MKEFCVITFTFLLIIIIIIGGGGGDSFAIAT